MEKKSSASKLKAGDLRKIFGTVNEYYFPANEEELRAWGRTPFNILIREEMYAKKSFFSDKWNIYKTVSGRDWECRSRRRGGTTYSWRMQPGRAKKIASGLTFEQAMEKLRQHEEKPSVYTLPARPGGAYSWSKTGGPLFVEKKLPPENKAYWRNVSS